MVVTRMGRWSLSICAAVLAAAALAAPANAQTGQVKGKVVDAQNKPVDGANVTIVQSDGASNAKYVLKTKKGEFMQIGIAPGNYTLTAEKDGLKQSFTVRIGLDLKEVNFTLKPGGAGGEMGKEEAAKAAAKVEGLKTKFSDAAILNNAGNYDEAIAKFNEVLVDVPKCAECYANIGSAYASKKEYDKSEEAFRKSIELDPASPDAYNGLATIFNSQKRMKEAMEMSVEASKRAAAQPGGGSPDTLYNQGVIAWNANDFAKAQESFVGALKINANHAESHFMLGKVLINLGKLGDAATEFETYMKIAPTGPNAKEAQSNFDALKGFRK